MTNPLIPYTFVPGTKAKAEEVNANFIALAEQVQDVQSSATEQIEQLQSVMTERIDAVETNVSENCADSDLVNTESITNTILESPNGVAEYDSQTVTVKTGIRVLIPNGRTSDNKLKNIEYTTEEVITKTVTNLTDVETAVFLYNTGSIEIVRQSYIFYKNSTPSTLVDNVHWYNIDENKWYKYVSSESRWVEIFAVPIANVIWNASSTISSMTTSSPINLIKASDLNNFYTLRGVLPRDLDYVVERYVNNWDYYILYKSGWVRQGGFQESSGDSYANFLIPMAIPYNFTVVRFSGGSTTANYPVWVRGSISSTYLKLYSGSSTSKIWSAEGYRLTREEF